jgi:hypothetical protein
VDVECPADRVPAIHHALHAGPVGHGGRVESSTIVLDLEHETPSRSASRITALVASEYFATFWIASSAQK